MKALQLRAWLRLAPWFRSLLFGLKKTRLCWGRRPQDILGPVVVFVPLSPARLNCGLAGLVSFHGGSAPLPRGQIDALQSLVGRIIDKPFVADLDNHTGPQAIRGPDAAAVEQLYQRALELKRPDRFLALFKSPQLRQQLDALNQRLEEFVSAQTADMEPRMGYMRSDAVRAAHRRFQKIKDAAWCLKIELLDNLTKVDRLSHTLEAPLPDDGIKIYRNINAVLNGIDRLEVRGRDSAGISLLFLLDAAEARAFETSVEDSGMSDDFNQRTGHAVLSSGSISRTTDKPDGLTAVTMTYKVAAEIGSLGDNGEQLRRAIAQDGLLRLLAQRTHRYHTVSAHTRWASVGAITIANCHPVDSGTADCDSTKGGIIHACLNGDIDNYRDLRERWEARGRQIPAQITTDTKIIPLQVEDYISQGYSLEEAFRLAVNDFQGSHAIALHSDLAPGKFFLAQRGGGQAVFVGLAQDHYIPTSEVYGFVEETSRFLKINGEKIFDGPNGETQGQIFILDQESAGGVAGIAASYYDGTPIALDEKDIQQTQITSRDIDRQGFAHYFLKEISESPLSVERTLSNRWKVDAKSGHYTIALEETGFPEKMTRAFKQDRIRRVYFIGQGTAGVAAQVSADILDHYLNDPSLRIDALRASELSGFRLGQGNDDTSMQETLVVAISQSGTTTDTNRAVEMARARGAYTLAIVNRRDSDITFKVDGVVYTSSGRDVEMSVASTKAFYSQIVAGTLIGLKIAAVRKCLRPGFITTQIKALRELPDQMRKVLALSERLKASAEKLAPSKTYWAAVGSGPNKAAADEIRIKLSELCYKTISSDYVEDKKHIDLSSEPLIIVCAAGTPPTVMGDIVKDTAIFKAHKAEIVVFGDEDDDRFDPHTKDFFPLPATLPHLAPILNTLAGHLWGYHAALAVDKGSRFLHEFRNQVQTMVDQYAREGRNVYEIVLDQTFREKVARFYARFRRRQTRGELPTVISHAGDLLLLFKYLSGRLPVSDFELDFGKKGTAMHMLDTLFEFLGRAINGMSRPVDAIKHQAKTVTVGTSRISEKVVGLLFDALAEHGISNAQLINRNVMVLKNLQGVVKCVHGSIHYRLAGLDVLGAPTKATTIKVLRKKGSLQKRSSRVETETALKGTKRIIVRQGNVYIGKGRNDDRSIIVIPAISTDPAASNRIEYLLLLNIGFKPQVPLADKIKALGGKYGHIKNIVQENSLRWEDPLLELLPIDDLFGLSAEKIAECIVAERK